MMLNNKKEITNNMKLTCYSLKHTITRRCFMQVDGNHKGNIYRKKKSKESKHTDTKSMKHKEWCQYRKKTKNCKVDRKQQYGNNKSFPTNNSLNENGLAYVPEDTEWLNGLKKTHYMMSTRDSL